jgi:hypothetical protein
MLPYPSSVNWIAAMFVSCPVFACPAQGKMIRVGPAGPVVLLHEQVGCCAISGTPGQELLYLRDIGDPAGDFQISVDNDCRHHHYASFHDLGDIIHFYDICGDAKLFDRCFYIAHLPLAVCATDPEYFNGYHDSDLAVFS